MRTIVLSALLTSSVAFADVEMQDSGTNLDGGVSSSVEAPAPMGLGEASNLVKTVFMSVKEGNWWMAAGALLVLVVGLLRGIGRKFHEWLPDNNIMDKPLIFLYDTKIGGWVLNWLTATAGGIATAMAAGVTVDWSLWKSVLMVSTSGTALFELYSDIKEWWVARQEAKKKAAEEEAAKKAALVSTPPTDVQKS